MPIVQVPYGNALPTEQNDYVRQNNLLAAGFMQVNKAKWKKDGSDHIVQGAVFQVGGTVYYANADTAIGNTPETDYIKLTPGGSAPNMTLTPSYVANLGGVSWDSTYNGYYDVSGNAYVFDEFAAVIAGEIASCNCRLWQAFVKFLQQDMTFSGNPTFSGDPAFSGDPTFSGNPTFSYGKNTADSYSANNPTENNIFDALDSYLPNTDDDINITGGAGYNQNAGGGLFYDHIYTISRAKRINSANIRLYFCDCLFTVDTGTVTGYNPTVTPGYIDNLNGSASVNFSAISIAW